MNNQNIRGKAPFINYKRHLDKEERLGSILQNKLKKILGDFFFLGGGGNGF